MKKWNFSFLILKLIFEFSISLLIFLVFIFYSVGMKNINEIKNFSIYFMICFLICIAMFYFRIKKIVNPIRNLEKEIYKIVNKDFNHPLKVEGIKEIEKIANFFEQIRLNLIDYNQNQKDLLDAILHEIKMPLMILNEELESLKKEKSLKTEKIDDMKFQINRLQKRSMDLIYIMNLDFLKYQGVKKEEIDIGIHICNLRNKMCFLRHNLIWQIEFKTVKAYVYKNAIMLAFQNILENQIKYANTRIKMILFETKDFIRFEIENDGPKIFQDPEEIFKPFERGEEKVNGMGLYISKRIIQLHNGIIGFKNLEQGVLFYIEFKKNPTNEFH